MNDRLTIGSMLAEEWKNIFKDRVIFVILLIGPIFYTFFSPPFTVIGRFWKFPRSFTMKIRAS
ncbi:hypothetical protein HMSSN036_89860 [Paenibacillus macerans]|nr:hypothetical protein HMSSN036_89860 [Paenibacillus macerans]